MHAVVSTELTTIADVLEVLPGIPLERIRLNPPPGTATEQDVIAIHDRENRLCELVDGILVEKTVGFYEARLALVLARILDDFTAAHDLGIVVGADGMMRLSPGLVRIPDAAFLSWSKLPDRAIPHEPIPHLAPDLTVEVLSASNTPQEMARKIDEYFAAGVRLVWLLDHRSRTMTVHTSPEQTATVTEDEDLDGGPVLPGFSVPLREVFERAGRQSGA
jgi:Uma2 family endonuclease